MTIGDKIRTHRKALGLTQTELGQRLGVKMNAVSKWECGRVEDIPMSKIKAMAALFEIKVSELTDLESDTHIAKAVSPERQEMHDLLETLSDDEVARLLQIARLSLDR